MAEETSYLMQDSGNTSKALSLSCRFLDDPKELVSICTSYLN